MRWQNSVLFLLLLSWSGAQEAPSLEPPLLTQADVAQLITTATDEALLATPALFSPTLAEALREAVVVRGVRVYLLVSPENAEARVSYVMSLSFAGVSVHLAKVTGGYLVVDRRQVVTGPLLARLEGTPTGETTQSRDANDVNRIILWFYEAFRAAPSYEPTIPNPVGEHDEP